MFGFMLVVGFGFLLGYFVFDIFCFMGVGEEIVVFGFGYMCIMFGGNVMVFLIFFINVIF